MNEEINLLVDRKKSAEFGKRLAKRLRITAVVLLVFVIATALVLFVLRLQLPLESLKKEENGLVQQVSLTRNKTAKWLLLKEKTTEIGIILAKRPDTGGSINIMKDIMPASINVSTFNINEDTILISATSPSLTDVDIFLNNLIAMMEKKLLTKVTLNGLGVQEQRGLYVLSLTIHLP